MKTRIITTVYYYTFISYRPIIYYGNLPLYYIAANEQRTPVRVKDVFCYNNIYTRDDYNSCIIFVVVHVYGQTTPEEYFISYFYIYTHTHAYFPYVNWSRRLSILIAHEGVEIYCFRHAKNFDHYCSTVPTILLCAIQYVRRVYFYSNER